MRNPGLLMAKQASHHPPPRLKSGLLGSLRVRGCGGLKAHPQISTALTRHSQPEAEPQPCAGVSRAAPAPVLANRLSCAREIR